MSNQLRSLDRITIPKPCDADWDSMVGNDQVRFCEHCNLHVNNLSSMTRMDAMRLVARSRGRLCVRYIQRPDGGVLTTGVPEKLYRISRRVSRIAAGAFTATLSLTSAAAQTSPASSSVAPGGGEQIIQKTRQTGMVPSESTASLSGTITDPNDAVVAGAQVTVISEDSHVAQTTTSSDVGEYTFQSLLPGRYTLRISSPGFRSFEATNVQLSGSSSQRVDARLEIGISLGGAVVIVAPEEPLVKAAYRDDLDAV